MPVILILFLFLSMNLFAHELRVQGTRRSFTLLTNPQEIKFMGDKTEISLIEKSCSQRFLEEFNEEFEKNIVRATSIKNSREKDNSKYYLNQQQYVVEPGSKVEKFILKIPEYMIKLKMMESHSCSKLIKKS